MIVNRDLLFFLNPIKNMFREKKKYNGVSYGMSEVGYEIRVKERVEFFPPDPVSFARACGKEEYTDEQLKKWFFGYTVTDGVFRLGRSALASSLEEFSIPTNLWCEFRNKSTFAREIIDCSLGTDGEPGWRGWLTIEMIFHGTKPFVFDPGTAVLKAVFHEITQPTEYDGKYQDQPNEPVQARYK